MDVITSIIEIVHEHLGFRSTFVLFALSSWLIANVVYNLYLHPLSKYPGPKLWAVSRLPYFRALMNATLVKRSQSFHEKYGDIVRIAPDEVSFADSEAWNDIYAHRRGYKRAPRDQTCYIAPGDTTDVIVMTNDEKFHARVRGLLSNSFTEEALRASHPLIQGHCDTLIRQFKNMASKDGQRGALINMSDWMTFFTMDVIGDMALGETFDCLEKGEYHDWVRDFFRYVKMYTIAAIPRYYSIQAAEFIYRKCLPWRVIEGQKSFMRYAYDKINRRLDSKAAIGRPDFMTPFMKNNAGYKNMSREEILDNFAFLMFGGSESTSTILTGIFNHLVRSPELMSRLTKDIRNHFQRQEDIVLDALDGTNLPYLDAVINEGMRLCNPIPIGLPRQVPEGGETYLGIFFPEGTRLRVATYTVCRSPAYFYDSNAFHPERWLEQSLAEFANDNLAASKPFATGYSACLGKPMVWDQMRLVLCRLLWSFDIWEEEGKGGKFEDWPMPSLIEKGPMWVRARVRAEL